MAFAVDRICLAVFLSFERDAVTAMLAEIAAAQDETIEYVVAFADEQSTLGPG